MADYEYTLCQKQQGVLIFKLPPISSAQGHYLDNWKEVIWEGGVRVTAQGDYATVSFINKDSSIQATCPVPINYQEAVQKTVDSTRGFAIRLKDPQGKFKWVGVAFRDRNDAFDFNVSLVDFEDKRKIEKNPYALKEEFELKDDLSLKQGQKIKLNIGGVGAQASGPSQPKNQKMDFGFGQLAWGDQQKQPAPTQNQNQFASFGNFSSSQPVQKKALNDFSMGQGQKQQQNFDFQFNSFQPVQQQQQQQPATQQQKQQSSSGQSNEANLLDL